MKPGYLICALSVFCGMALPVAAEVLARNGSSVMVVTEQDDARIGFTLSLGVAAGEAACVEGNVDCITVSGTALRDGDGYAFTSPDDPASMFAIFATSAGYEIAGVTGDFGAGSANRFRVAEIAGAYVADGGDIAAVDYNLVSPSGNIECSLLAAEAGSLRCDMGELTPSFGPRPEDCMVDWGHAFGLEASGMPAMLCYGDTVAGPQRVVLAYGQSIQFGGFVCSSEKTGFTCVNPDGHGFTLSKARQVFF